VVRKTPWRLSVKETPGRRSPNPPVALRDFPYPYRAALTITGDLDDLRTARDFSEVARFLGDSEETSLGRGLGLELSHSFWFFDTCGECEFTVFEGDGPELTPHADLIADLIRSGHIDVMHTYGNFSRGGFTRAHAERARAFLLERGLQVPVWVNHGGSLNTQMVGDLPEQLGDTPGTAEYHADIMTECGVRFIETFEIVHTVGQDTAPSLRDRAVQAVEAARYAAAGDRARASRVRANALLEPRRLGDGTRVYSFKRFIGRGRGLERAGSPELSRQLDRGILDELIEKRGWMSVYTHPWRNPGGEALVHPDAAQSLRALAAEEAGGRIYVTTTSRLLRLNLVMNRLVWDSDVADGRPVIRIDRVADEILGAWIPTDEELAGLTFYTDVPAETRIFIGEREIRGIVVNPPDESGRSSVSVPLTRFPAPALPTL
jgi:hypothetical protein